MDSAHYPFKGVVTLAQGKVRDGARHAVAVAFASWHAPRLQKVTRELVEGLDGEVGEVGTPLPSN
jgi:hypothetical protein